MASCSVCAHVDAIQINEDLVLRRLSNRRTATHYGVSESSIRRHKRHIPQLLAKALEAEEASQADELLGQVRDLQARTLAVLEAAEVSKEHRTALAAIREARGNLELLAKLLGELDERPVVNILIAPEVRDVIVSALAPYGEARLAVANALESFQEAS